MKLLLTVGSVLLLSLAAMAQDKGQFNIFGGVHASSASYTVQSVKQNTSYKLGGQLGVGMKVPFENHLFFAPAIFYSMKGYKVNFTRFAYPPDVEATDNNTTFHNLELAFLLQYDFTNTPSSFFIKAGPTLDFHILGNEKFHKAGNLVDRSIPFGYDKYGHYSANFLLQFGKEMNNGFFVFGQYTHGLADVNNADLGPRIRHRLFGISVGKFIGKN